MLTTTDCISLIKQRLQSLEPQRLTVTDDSAAHKGHGASGGHYSVEIVSQVFAGKNLPERHRLVYQALGELMQSQIHALRIRAKSPAEAN